MIIAEYTLDHPILRKALADAPETAVVWEASHQGPEGQRQFVAWVESDDPDAFEEAVHHDPSVENPDILAETDGRRLYRVELTREGTMVDIMPLLVEVGGVQRKLVGTSDGWLNRTRFPDRHAFERVHQFCRDHDIDFTFHRIYQRSERFGPDIPALSDAQRETLIEAVDSGYLDIPRQSSLEELGDRLGISESAASERFRRGVKALVEGAIDSETERETR